MGKKTNTELVKEVIDFVAAQRGVKPEKIGLPTRLSQDLGVGGDDGDDLIIDFGRRFNVDLTGFDSLPYFGEEAAFNPLVYLYFLLFDRKKLQLTPLTIRDLVEAAERGRWRA